MGAGTEGEETREGTEKSTHFWEDLGLKKNLCYLGLF